MQEDSRSLSLSLALFLLLRKPKNQTNPEKSNNTQAKLASFAFFIQLLTSFVFLDAWLSSQCWDFHSHLLSSLSFSFSLFLYLVRRHMHSSRLLSGCLFLFYDFHSHSCPFYQANNNHLSHIESWTFFFFFSSLFKSFRNPLFFLFLTFAHLEVVEVVWFSSFLNTSQQVSPSTLTLHTLLFKTSSKPSFGLSWFKILDVHSRHIHFQIRVVHSLPYCMLWTSLTLWASSYHAITEKVRLLCYTIGSCL